MYAIWLFLVEADNNTSFISFLEMKIQMTQEQLPAHYMVRILNEKSLCTKSAGKHTDASLTIHKNEGSNNCQSLMHVMNSSVDCRESLP